MLTLFISVDSISGHPLALHLTAAHNIPAKTAGPSLDTRDAQTVLDGASNSTGRTMRTLQDLYTGNTQYRKTVRLQAANTIDENPSFMFLGCSDNRMSPATIFNAPAGSVMTHNNIGNQYSSNDPSSDAAIAYAIESGHVQHIFVLGHYGCKGVEMAITRESNKASRQIKSWIKPISDLYARTRRSEIVILRDSRMPRRGLPNGIKTAPPANDAGFRALVEENVKKSVKELHRNSVLKQAHSRHAQTDKDHIDVFVHGLVYDEGTGEVHDLHVSFGPPGKEIPRIPFQAVAAAKNFHRDSSKPDKKWDFGSH
jgi:carbonic anhydrase